MSETGNGMMANLELRQKEAEIRKTEAETAALAKPQGFFHSNWALIATTVATLLTALGGSSALISSMAALRTADQTMNYREAVVAANEKANQARKDSLDARETEDDAKNKTAEFVKKQEELDSQTKALSEEKKGLDQTLAAERSEVDGEIAFSSTLKVQLALEQARLANAKAELENAAKSTQNQVAKSALTKAVSGISSTAAAGTRLVYLEYFDKDAAKAMTGLQAVLKAKGFTAPGIQQIDQRHLNVAQPDEVRYFRAEDKALAQQVADIANGYLATACGSHPKISPRRHGTQTPTSQLEIWTAFTCEKT